MVVIRLTVGGSLWFRQGGEGLRGVVVWILVILYLGGIEGADFRTWYFFFRYLWLWVQYHITVEDLNGV